MRHEKCPNCHGNNWNYYTVEDLIKDGANPKMGRGLYAVWRCETCDMNYDVMGTMRNIYEDYDWREYDKHGHVRTEPETFEERWER